MEITLQKEMQDIIPPGFSRINTTSLLYSDGVNVKYLSEDSSTFDTVRFLDDSSFIYEVVPIDIDDVSPVIRYVATNRDEYLTEIYYNIKQLNTTELWAYIIEKAYDVFTEGLFPKELESIAELRVHPTTLSYEKDMATLLGYLKSIAMYNSWLEGIKCKKLNQYEETVDHKLLNLLCYFYLALLATDNSSAEAIIGAIVFKFPTQFVSNVFMNVLLTMETKSRTFVISEDDIECIPNSALDTLGRERFMELLNSYGKRY